MTTRRRRVAAVLGIASLAFAAIAAAQQIWVGGSGYGRFAPRFANLEDFDGRFLYCRAFFQSAYGRGGWTTDYPGADNNFSVRLAELSRVAVKFDPNRQPHHVVVRLDEPTLFRCPVLFMENVEMLRFTEQDVIGLRNYLLKGGFLWVDDFWGEQAWDQWSRELARAMPPPEFTIEDVPLSDPIFKSMIQVKKIPQVPGIGFWRAAGGQQTSERGAETAEPHFRAMRDRRGRIMVVMTHNTDVSNSWERESEDPRYFYQFSIDGYALGIDVFLYAMTH